MDNINITNIPESLTESHCDCAAYSGTVAVSAYLDGRLIQKQVKHNSGLPTLFAFIANCLEGTWTEARANRPCKLALLKTAKDENILISNPMTDKTAWGSNHAVASPIMHDSAVISASANSLTSSITYHFRVPFLSLVAGSEIQKLLLLPADPTSYADEACAYFVLDNPIVVPTSGGNFTVIVDWTLTFVNQTGGN